MITVDPERGNCSSTEAPTSGSSGWSSTCPVPVPLFQRAGLRAGILSSAIGIAGYTSIDTGRPVRIDEVVRL